MSNFLPFPITGKDAKAHGPGPLRIGWYPDDAYNHYPIRKALTLAAGATGAISIPIASAGGISYIAAVGHTWRPSSLFTLSAGPINWPQTNGQRASIDSPFYFQPPARIQDDITFSITNNSGSSQTYEFLAYILSTGNFSAQMAQTDLLNPESYDTRFQPYYFSYLSNAVTVGLHGGFVTASLPTNTYPIFYKIRLTMINTISVSNRYYDVMTLTDRANTLGSRIAGYYDLNAGTIVFNTDFPQPGIFGTLADIITFTIHTGGTASGTLQVLFEFWGWNTTP